MAESIKVNYANPEELQLIPGVGVKMVRTIIALRESYGYLPKSLSQFTAQTLGGYLGQQY